MSFAKRFILWCAVGAYAAAIFYFSSLENPLPQLVSRFSDKVLHGIEYGGLGLLVMVALLASNVRARPALGIAVVVASLYAASDEVHQSFVPGRDADVRDWVADTIGAVVGSAIAFYPRRQVPRQPRAAGQPEKST